MPEFKCTVPGCQAQRKRNQLMCLTHWRKVPKALRDEVWRTAWDYEANECSFARDSAFAACVRAIRSVASADDGPLEGREHHNQSDFTFTTGPCTYETRMPNAECGKEPHP